MKDSASKLEQRGYKVSLLEDNDRERWDEFVEASPGGTFFHLSGWKHILDQVLRHPTRYFLCEREGILVGVLPLAQVKSLLFGNVLISLPFLVYGGVVSSDPVAEEILVAAARDEAIRMGVDHLELRNKVRSSRDWLVKDKYVTFSKRLDPDPEKNLLAIPRKQRAMIRKGIKAGLQAEVDSDASRLHEALLECKRNLGTPFFGRRYLQALKDEFGDRAEILTITRDGAIICSVMSFRFRNEILPYYGGGGEAARDVKGNDFMYWAVMEKACADGIEVFDYGRSMIGSGAYRFKKHWGFEPEVLNYELLPVAKQITASLDPSNPKFQLLIATWKRLPLSIAGLIGPPVARRLG